MPDGDRCALRELVARRRQLTGLCCQEQIRLASTSPANQPRIQAHLDWLQTDLAQLNQELQTWL